MTGQRFCTLSLSRTLFLTGLYGWPDFDRQWRYRRADGAADAEFASLVEALGGPFYAPLWKLPSMLVASQPALALQTQGSPPLQPDGRVVRAVY